LKPISGARIRTRIAIVGVAALVVAGGLALAVGAGARDGPSVRDASYPVTYAYKIKITNQPAKASSNKAVFAFHAVYTSTGTKPPHSNLKYYRYVCKLDKKHAGTCTSPKTYRGLSKGRHAFKVKLVAKTTGTAVSATKKVKWTIK